MPMRSGTYEYDDFIENLAIYLFLNRDLKGLYEIIYSDLEVTTKILIGCKRQ